jgi:predicted nucleotidyltransferase
MGIPGVRKHETTPSRVTTADALFSRTQQKVLALLFGQPQRSFFASEIIGLAGQGSGAVQRELARLEGSGLVTTTRVGNQKHYQANKDAPIFSELTSIVGKTFGIADLIAAALEPLRARMELALIYGSTAKGTAVSGSDIDLLIVSDDLALEQIYAVLEPVELRLQRRINPTAYKTAEFRRRLKAGQGFLKRVTEGKNIVLIGSMDAAKATR